MVRGPVFITGGASGIGLAIARALSGGNCPVALFDLDAVECVAEDLAREANVPILAYRCDVRDERALEAAFTSAVMTLGAPRGLVTSAGVDRGGVFHELELTDWEAVLAVNLRGTFLACRAAIRAMLAEGGSIVCVSSPFARVSPPGGTAAYCASKGAVCALVRSLAVDYGPSSIRVNALLPGPTETGLMWANVAPGEVAAVRASVRREVPLGRLADPAEPAAAAVWLLSDAASYVTGSELACDAGVLAKASVSV